MPEPDSESDFKLQPLSQSEEGESALESMQEIIKSLVETERERKKGKSEVTNRTQRGCDVTLTGAGG